MSTSLRATIGGLAVLVAVGAFLLLRPDSEPRRATSAAATQPAPIEGAPGQSTAAERAAEAESEGESESEGDATSETAPQREREPT
ncbi:MAG: hypothetical protein H0U79_05110, partial [Solirubrobacterales bacterium]|nr:hypothetical protein [Solirubrobacterales bacterium]